MKTRSFILRIIFLINLLSCNGQEKKIVSNQKNSVTNNDSISQYFNSVNKFYFDHERKIILSTSLVENVGKFTIYYFPVTKESLDYCNNFENNNKIKPLYDELNSAYYYSDKDRLQIQKTLRNKTKSEKEFKIIGSFVPIKYIQVENPQEYSIPFPYAIDYYQQKNNKWIHLSSKKLSKAEEDLQLNSNNNLFDSTASAKNSKLSLPLSLKGISILDYPTPEKYKNIQIDGSTPTSVAELNDNVLILFFEGDTERWYLVTIKDSKIADKLLIGKSETVEAENGSTDHYIDFTIDKNFKINLEYSTGKNSHSAKTQKTESFQINFKNNRIEKL